MVDKKIEILVAKYCANQLNDDEARELGFWIELDNNKAVFKKFISLNYTINQGLNKNELSKSSSWKYIESKIIKKSKVSIFWKYGIAASMIILFGASFFLTKDKANNSINIGTDKATLTLENGADIVLEKGETYISKSIKSDGKKLIYDSKVSVAKNVFKYNYLTIPRGGQFFVQLSDGTSVWLNSDSKLKYPVTFANGQDRKVELVYGEAFFDVSPSTKHNGDAFKIQTRKQEIEVLGTAFNIKAYQDEKMVVTTLVEGKITVGNGVEYKVLNPSEQSIINDENQNIAILKVKNVFEEIAWKEGYFSFNKKPMKDIMKILSRWYNAKYVFKDVKKEAKSFTGILDRKTSINEILLYIQKTNEIEFIIKDDTIIIK